MSARLTSAQRRLAWLELQAVRFDHPGAGRTATWRFACYQAARTAREAAAADRLDAAEDLCAVAEYFASRATGIAPIAFTLAPAGLAA